MLCKYFKFSWYSHVHFNNEILARQSLEEAIKMPTQTNMIRAYTVSSSTDY